MTKRHPIASFFITAGWWLATLYVSLNYDDLSALSNRTLAIVNTAVVVLALVNLSTLSRRGAWSPASIFFLLFALFHHGLSVHWIWGIDPQLVRTSDTVWLYGPLGSAAQTLALIASCGYMAGAAAVSLLSKEVQHPALENDVVQVRLAGLGFLMLMVSIGYWILRSMIAGGPTFFLQPYGTYLETTEAVGFSYVYSLISVGLALLCISRIERKGKIGLMLFILFATLALPLGLRGEVLFPVAVAATVVSARRRMPRGRVLIGAVVCGLFLAGLIKQVRQEGLVGTEAGSIGYFSSPLSALAELGSTLRVVVQSILWHNYGGEPFRGGDTYTSSFFRLAERSLGQETSASDYRLMNVEISERSGPIGGSVLAEVHHNFSIIGVIIVFTLLGVLFSSFSRRFCSPYGLAFYSCLAAPLFVHVRNSFTPVLPVFMVTFFLVWIAVLLWPAVAINRRQARDNSTLQTAIDTTTLNAEMPRPSSTNYFHYSLYNRLYSSITRSIR